MFAAFAGVDWNVAAAALATFIVTAVATALGFRKGWNKVKAKPPETTLQVPIAGATLMDNMSMIMLTEAIKENTQVLRDLHPCLIEIKLIAQLSKRD